MSPSDSFLQSGKGETSSRVRLSDSAEAALMDLRSRAESAQMRGMANIKVCVETAAREVSREEFTVFITELNKRIFDLVKSDEPHEKMGGISKICHSPHIYASLL